MNNKNPILLDIRKSILQNSQDREDTPLHLASFAGECEKLVDVLRNEKGRSFVNKKNRLGCTPLRLAATAGHTDCVLCLLNHGADIDVIDVKGQTPLYVAVKNKHVDCIKLLLKSGANPDGSIQCMCSPLYTAAFEGFFPALKELIKYGADINVSQKTHNKVPLQICLAYNRFQCFRELLLAGADPDFHLKQTSSIKYISATNGEVCDLRTNTSSLYHTAVKNNVNLLYPELLYQFGAGLYYKDSKGQLPCELDEDNQCSQFVKLLYVTPRTLLQTCRISIRRGVTEVKNLHQLDQLPLPSTLINYLAHTSS